MSKLKEYLEEKGIEIPKYFKVFINISSAVIFLLFFRGFRGNVQAFKLFLIIYIIAIVAVTIVSQISKAYGKKDDGIVYSGYDDSYDDNPEDFPDISEVNTDFGDEEVYVVKNSPISTNEDMSVDNISNNEAVFECEPEEMNEVDFSVVYNKQKKK